MERREGETENEYKKRYLRQYGKAVRTVKRLEQRIEELRMNKELPAALASDGMPHGHTIKDLSDYIVRLEEREKAYADQIGRRICLYEEISDKIDTVQNEDERDVLFLRYVKQLDWEDVAKEMNMSLRKVYYLHGQALKKIRI